MSKLCFRDIYPPLAVISRTAFDIRQYCRQLFFIQSKMTYSIVVRIYKPVPHATLCGYGTALPTVPPVPEPSASAPALSSCGCICRPSDNGPARYGQAYSQESSMRQKSGEFLSSSKSLSHSFSQMYISATRL